MIPSRREDKTLVLGIGNDIRGDDGIGVRIARLLEGELPAQFVVRECPTAGFDLLEALAGYKKAFLIDAVQTPGGVAGEVYDVAVESTDTSRPLAPSHALSLPNVLELGKLLLGARMPEVRVLAIEAVALDAFSESLSAELEGTLNTIVRTVRGRIERED